ncbi:TetR/AcrR family transcriptional regulator [Quadrisphaera sp. DSM 44207]|uniref:TetR/AcrR family transcriptional regulator n=1 Tax=Quadrisphaera sp. DSM 44207 TaxID=1881057 RepID=UPI00088A236C|nr:TetR/AcrR family transcriptional regulator [Quadrisphaera sp. DSM 44207]SDQ05234.1 transcriptional regulator, TetR family [Quadrisphaera sp. DSM 44207]
MTAGAHAGDEHAGDPRVLRSRAAVLDAATELLLQRGLEGVTVDAVLARSGVARSTLYRHWSGRADLLEDVLRRLVPAPTPPPPPGPLRERLAAIALGVARDMREQEAAPTIVTLLHAARVDPELAEFSDAFTAEQHAPLRAVLADARAAGQLRDDVPDDDVAGLLIGPLFLRAVVVRDPVNDAWVRGHAERVHRAVAP